MDIDRYATNMPRINFFVGNETLPARALIMWKTYDSKAWSRLATSSFTRITSVSKSPITLS